MAQFKAPELKYPKEPDKAYLLRLEKLDKAYARVGFGSYSPDSYIEKRKAYAERRNVDLQRQYSDLTTETLLSVHRVFLPHPNMFELENGELTSAQLSSQQSTIEMAIS